MFKKLLFLLILAGLGFGIYTGISKIVQMVNTPNEPVVISTGTTTTDVEPEESTDIQDTSSQTGDIVEAIVEVEEPGFFARTWATIKGWFTSDEVEIIESPESEETLSGEVFSGEVLSGDTSILLSGEVFDWESTSTGEVLSEETSKDILSGSIEKPTVHSGIIPPTTSPKKSTTIKKTTTSKTTVTTSTTEKDPLLDALFR